MALRPKASDEELTGAYHEIVRCGQPRRRP
jgi:hypothetical protein